MSRRSRERGVLYGEGDSLWKTPLCASVYHHTDAGGAEEDEDFLFRRDSHELRRRLWWSEDDDGEEDCLSFQNTLLPPALLVKESSRSRKRFDAQQRRRGKTVERETREPNDKTEEGRDRREIRRMAYRDQRGMLNLENNHVRSDDVSSRHSRESNLFYATSSSSLFTSPLFSSLLPPPVVSSSEGSLGVSPLSASARQEASTIVSPPSIHVEVSGNRTHLEALANGGFVWRADDEEDEEEEERRMIRSDFQENSGRAREGSGGEAREQRRQSERGRESRRIRRTLASLPSYCLQAEDILSTIEAVQRPSLLTRLRGLELRSFVIDDQHFFESLLHHLIALPRSERPPLQVLRIQDYENEDISSFLGQSQKHMFFGAEAEAQRRRFRVFESGNSDLEELAEEDSDEVEEETGTDTKEEERSVEEEEKGDGVRSSPSHFRDDKRGVGGRRGIIKRGRSAFCCCKICRRTRTARRGRSLLFKKKEGGSQEVKNVERRRRREKQRDQGTEVFEEVEKEIGDEEYFEEKKENTNKSSDLEPPPSPRVNPCPSPYPFDDCSSSPYLSSDFSLPPPMWDYEKPFFFYFASSCSPPPSHCPPPPVSFLVIPRMMQRNLKCLLHHFPEINRIELSFPSKKFFPSQEHILDFLGPFAVFLEAFNFDLDPVHLQVVLRGCPCCSQEVEEERERRRATGRRRGVERRREETSGRDGERDRVRTGEVNDHSSKGERKQGPVRQKKKTRKSLLPTKKQPSLRCYLSPCSGSLSHHRQQCLRRMLRDELNVFYVGEQDINNRFKKFENDQFLLGYPSHHPPYVCLVCDEEQLNEDGNQHTIANDDVDNSTEDIEKRSAIYAQIYSEYRESVRRREAVVEKHRKALKVNSPCRNFLACREQGSLSKETTPLSSSSGRRYVLLGFVLKEIVFLRKNSPSPTQPLSPSSDVAPLAQE
ncbi:hypothetical protein CSUI_002994 [Cystoisospora suis]|uniref:Uncharacterized protein n=1 Tax=Cystoisospora suis TaxID=483139 RepID=A0A2C6KGK1_9APIC|nr:hypothetical protein CSUI_002994 [Cystoisospora suis]